MCIQMKRTKNSQNNTEEGQCGRKVRVKHHIYFKGIGRWYGQQNTCHRI